MIPDKERITVRLILSVSIMKTAGHVYVNLVLKPQLVYRFFDVTISTSVPVVKIHTTVTPMLYVQILLVVSHVLVTLASRVMVVPLSMVVLILMNVPKICLELLQIVIPMPYVLILLVVLHVNVRLVSLVMAIQCPLEALAAQISTSAW